MKVISILISIYVIISLFVFLEGGSSANFKYSGCGTHNRIEKAFPTYRLGCYLFKELD